jgi:hypothetical protein
VLGMHLVFGASLFDSEWFISFLKFDDPFQLIGLALLTACFRLCYTWGKFETFPSFLFLTTSPCMCAAGQRPLTKHHEIFSGQPKTLELGNFRFFLDSLVPQGVS